MRAMVFAAGLGTRLRPLTNVIPKPLAPVGAWPLVRYAVETCKAAGIREIAMNVFHLPDALPKAIGDGSEWGVKITWSREGPAILGTGGGLREVREFLSAEGDFVVINGDTIIDFELKDAIAKHRATKATATMVLKRDRRVDQYGAIGYESDGRVRDFVGRAPVPAGLKLEKALFTGVHVLSPRVFDFIAPAGEANLGSETYPSLLKAGELVQSVLQDGYWSDLGTAERLLEANLDLIGGVATFSGFEPLRGYVQRPAGVWVGPNAMIGPGVSLRAPALIGANATIDANATIGPGAIVGKNAVVPSGVTLERCLVLDGVTVSGTAKNAILAPSLAPIYFSKG